MPLSSRQLAALVERAKAKAPPPPPSAPPRPQQALPATPPAATAPVQRLAPAPPIPRPVPPPPRPVPPPPPPAAKAAEPEPAVEPDDGFPIGWHLTKESWHFHRKFHRLFRRTMREGEYSHLLWQVRRRTAEHLGENYWRVTLPDRGTKLTIVANVWKLITILPKGWKPPEEPEVGGEPCTEDA